MGESLSLSRSSNQLSSFLFFLPSSFFVVALHFVLSSSISISMFSGFGDFIQGDAGFLPNANGIAIPQTFEDYFRCYPVSMMTDSGNKETVNYGGKVFLPQSALHKLTMMNIRYPMLFAITSETSGKSTHSGVLEFTAEEGRCYMPQWMLDTINAEPGTLVKIQTTDLAQGTFVKLEPQSVDFLDISDPKAVLENALRNFATLTVGDIIELNYNDQIYRIKVLEVKPESSVHGICVIETDLITDFAPPVGYVEPDYEKQKEGNAKLRREKALAAPSLRGEGSMAKQINYGDILKESAASTTKLKFRGEGVKLSGRKVGVEAVESKEVKEEKPDLSGPPRALNLPDGYLFFGFPVVPYRDEVEEAEQNREAKKEALFKGEGNTLRHAKKRKDKNRDHPPVKNKAHSPDTIVID
ncbi:DEKNAAC103867 [Brettanomyces naardenensis]|uniref:DEKNAAC103867 n=1 Tax=Brettanomyces naardenensis TaxID=13370 RepID=A0A448YPK3_BRENA|nr:DEKNAAC103867 [Brettanomyces naardenensis]